MARPLPPRPHRIGLAWRIAVASSKKPVDRGLELSIKDLFDCKLIEANALRSGSLSWHADPLHFHGPISFEADLRGYETASLQLRYEIDGLEVDSRISLVFIEPALGGRRWYFCCPLTNIRVTKLFLPPGARRFASRHAHGLPDFPAYAKRMKKPSP